MALQAKAGYSRDMPLSPRGDRTSAPHGLPEAISRFRAMTLAMYVTTLRQSTATDVPALIEVWRHAVLATHHFLSPSHFEEIEALVSKDYLPHAPLWVAVDGQDVPCAFMGLSGAHIDSLFVAPSVHGKGVGSRLVSHASKLAGMLTVDVNEQNTQALGFYLRLGFEPTGRSETDDAGRPYPLVHLRMGAR